MAKDNLAIKELPSGTEMEWKNPAPANGRHLSTDFIPLGEYLAMRKRIGGRQAFMPKTNFSSDAMAVLAENPVMKALKDSYVMSSHTMEPEAIAFILQAIEMYRPRVILELGSGLSTLVLSEAHNELLKTDGVDGAYVAVEQSQEFMDTLLGTAKSIGSEKDFTPLIVPLARYKIGDILEPSDAMNFDQKAMPGFDFDEKNLHEALGGLRPDMIIIDGPADEKTLAGSSFAKALTLPLLSLYAAPGAVVLMDGCYGDPEIFALEQWQQSGIANIIGIKAVGKGLMVALT